LDGFRFPDPPGDDAFAHYPKFIEENKEYFLVANGAYLFEVAWALRGMEALLVDMYRHPGFVDDLMGNIVEYFLPLIERTLKYDIDAFAFGDDWGYQDGLLMGAKHWRRFIKPGMARMFSPIKRAGKVTHLHSDGNTTEILEDLIEIGLDVYNPFQPEVMDVFELKKRYGDRLCFHGGIGVQSLLPLGSPDEVRAQVRRMIEVVGAGGRYILSPSHTVLADTPVENIVALIETVRAQ
jgi:uroporphyrinogen decarboxylase